MIYKYNGTTDSKGNSTISLGYEGNYSLLAESFYYYGKAISINLTGNSSIVMNMYPRALHSLNVTLVNAYNLTNGGNVTIPEQYLNITNYKQSLYIMTQKQVPGVGTVFNYSLPEGNFSFTYSNVNYVTHSFYANISNTDNTTVQNIKPYLIILESNTSAFYQYTISQSVPGVVSSTGSYFVDPNASYQKFLAGRLNASYDFTASFGSDVIESSIFSLSLTDPVRVMYLNITSGNSSEPQSLWNVFTYDSSSLRVTTDYVYNNASISNNQYIYSVSVNYTLGTGLTAAINGVQQTGFTRAGDTITLQNYYIYTGTAMNVSLGSYYGIYSAPGYGELQNSSMIFYYYTPAFNYILSNGGS